MHHATCNGWPCSLQRRMEPTARYAFGSVTALSASRAPMLSDHHATQPSASGQTAMCNAPQRNARQVAAICRTCTVCVASCILSYQSHAVVRVPWRSPHAVRAKRRFRCRGTRSGCLAACPAAADATRSNNNMRHHSPNMTAMNNTDQIRHATRNKLRATCTKITCNMHRIRTCSMQHAACNMHRIQHATRSMQRYGLIDWSAEFRSAADEHEPVVPASRSRARCRTAAPPGRALGSTQAPAPWQYGMLYCNMLQQVATLRHNAAMLQPG